MDDEDKQLIILGLIIGGAFVICCGAFFVFALIR